MSGAPCSGLVVVLFTDLVGSTELMSQLGDRAFDELRRAHFAALAKALAARGGEEVKNTGDGLVAVFPSAAEAVEAAVAMHPPDLLGTGCTGGSWRRKTKLTRAAKGGLHDCQRRWTVLGGSWQLSSPRPITT